MSPLEEILAAYGKNPPNKGTLAEPTISHHEENRLCTDQITVHLRLSDAGTITDFAFEGDLTIVTTACASIFGESIVGMSAREILGLTYTYMRELLGADISSRRRPASVFALLATRNALHQYLGDGRADDFSDIFV